MTYNIHQIDNIAKYTVGEISTDTDNNVIIYVRTLTSLPKGVRLSVSDEYIATENNHGIYKTINDIPANNYFWAIDKSAKRIGDNNALYFNNNEIKHWTIALDGVPDSGDNTGSNLIISRFDNKGDIINTPVLFKRDTGEIIFSGDVIITGKLTVSDPLIANQSTTIPVSKVAVTGNYQDLNNLPKIPTKLSQLYDDRGGRTDNNSLATVATTGNYFDLNNIPPPVDISAKADKNLVNNKINEITNSVNLMSAFVVKKDELQGLVAAINTKLMNRPEKTYFDAKISDFINSVHAIISDKIDKNYVDKHFAILAEQCAMKADSHHTDSNISKIADGLLSKVDHSYVDNKLISVEKISNKNVPGGYAGLDDNGKLIESMLPTILPTKQLQEFSFDVIFLNGAPVEFQNIPDGWTVSTLTAGVVHIINNLGYPISGSIWTTMDGDVYTQRVIGTSDTNFSYKLSAHNELYINGVSGTASAKIKLCYLT